MLPALPTDREALADYQATRLATLLRTIHGRNRFYTRKLDGGRPRELALSGRAGNGYSSSTALSTFCTDSFASPNSSDVLSA